MRSLGHYGQWMWLTQDTDRCWGSARKVAGTLAINSHTIASPTQAWLFSRALQGKGGIFGKNGLIVALLGKRQTEYNIEPQLSYCLSIGTGARMSLITTNLLLVCFRYRVSHLMKNSKNMSEYIYVTELALSTNIHTQTKFKSQIVSSIRTLHLPQPRTDHLLKKSYHGYIRGGSCPTWKVICSGSTYWHLIGQARRNPTPGTLSHNDIHGFSASGKVPWYLSRFRTNLDCSRQGPERVCGTAKLE